MRAILAVLNVTRPTLGEGLARRDAQGFVGRARELRRLEELLAAPNGPSVVFIHGPGGVGKSTLVRELARRAAAHGFTSCWIEGRDLPPVPDAIDDALIEARAEARPLVVIDTFERISGLGGYLRTSVLPNLPERSLVIIAGRRPPEDAWHQAGWENMVAEFRLEGMPNADALEILRRNGLDAGADADRALRWARGLPLALTLAARMRHERSDDGLREPELVDLLIRRLAEHELDQAHADTLSVAAIARATTPAMLAEVLPDMNAADEYEWLRNLSFVDSVGDGVALHELVAETLVENLRRRSPERERALRVRIADHLHERARRGEMMLSIDLAHLAENPAIRWGYSWEMAARFRVDDVLPDDVGRIQDFLRGTHRESSLPVTERFLRETPEHVAVVRDSTDALRGYAIAVTPDGAPEFALADPLLGPRVEQARRLGRAGAVISRDVYDIAQASDESPIPMLGMASVLRAVRGNPRFAYLPINPEFPGAPEFAAALGAEHVVELDARIDHELIECHVVDYGPGGLLAAQREVIHLEAGLPAPQREPEDADVHEAVREALRSLQVPRALAASPLAQGNGTDNRAASVRNLLERGAERCFGHDANEELMRRVLIRGYLEPAVSHEVAADDVSLSRSAYFRRLRLATERLADYIESERPLNRAGPPPG
ncbi:MAG: ATP-binding protein [Solirubrobacterales bacterium]